MINIIPGQPSYNPTSSATSVISVPKVLKAICLATLMFSPASRANPMSQDMRKTNNATDALQARNLNAIDNLPSSFSQAQQNFPRTYAAIEDNLPFNDILKGVNDALISCGSSKDNVFYTRSTPAGDFILCKNSETKKHEDQISIQFKLKGTEEPITLAKIGKEVKEQPGYYKFVTAGSCDVLYSRMDQTCFKNIAKNLAQDVLPLVGQKTSDEQLGQAINKAFAPMAQQFEGLPTQCTNTGVLAVEGLSSADANSVKEQYTGKITECKRDQGNTRMIVPYSWMPIQALSGGIAALFSAFEAATVGIGGPAWQPGLQKHNAPEQHHITEL